MWLYNKLFILFNPMTRNSEPLCIKLLQAFGYSAFYFFFVGVIFYLFIAPVVKKIKTIYKRSGLTGTVVWAFKSIKFTVAYILLFCINLFKKISAHVKSSLDLFPRLKAWITSIIVFALSICIFLGSLVLFDFTPIGHKLLFPDPQVVTKYIYEQVPMHCACCTCEVCDCFSVIINTSPEVERTPEEVAFDEYLGKLPKLTDADIHELACVVCGEAGNQTFENKKLVAECLLNGMLKDKLTVKQVRAAYGYEGYTEVDTYGNPDVPEEYERRMDCYRAVEAVFINGERPVEENILYFYSTTNCGNRAGDKSFWHETQRFVIEEGAHRFFARWDW